METCTKPQENGVGEDFGIIEEKSVFSFLDSPSFREWPESASEPPPVTGSDNNYGLWFQMATNPQDYIILKQNLDRGMYVQETFTDVFPHIFKLMSDARGAHVFGSLLRFCSTYDLCVIMDKFVSEKNDFVNTAKCHWGSLSIQAFARRLVNTGLEGSLTTLLAQAELAYVIMTNSYGWHIFEQCFALFEDEPNQILYCWVLALFGRLAMDPAGYLVVNATMTSVRGYAQRDLLSLVINNAAKLSYHEYGNFVVQHCLSLKHEMVNRHICAALKGQFVELAQKKGGSYVVEICLELSDFGRNLVLAEIFKDDRTLEMLAMDRLGNYVVQMALEVTRIRDQNTYHKMSKALQPRCSNVVRDAILSKKRGKLIG